jgi:hypothetical protein
MSEPTQNTNADVISELPSEFYVGENIYQTMNVESTIIVFESCAVKEL